MSKITFSEAVNIIPVSDSTLRRHMRSGKVSSEKDHSGRHLFDTAELARVYVNLKINGNPPLSDEPVKDSQMTDNDTSDKNRSSPRITEHRPESPTGDSTHRERPTSGTRHPPAEAE